MNVPRSDTSPVVRFRDEGTSPIPEENIVKRETIVASGKYRVINSSRDKVLPDAPTGFSEKHRFLAPKFVFTRKMACVPALGKHARENIWKIFHFIAEENQLLPFAPGRLLIAIISVSENARLLDLFLFINFFFF